MGKQRAVVMFLAVMALAGCDRGPEHGAAPRAEVNMPVHELGIDELDEALAEGQCTVLDANQRPVRVRNGKIPGATLLSHYRDYQLDELPADKQRRLVFYCANKACKASDAAAQKALLAGYTDVHVLRAGIMGWARAGKKTEAVQ